MDNIISYCILLMSPFSFCFETSYYFGSQIGMEKQQDA
jgi:hypothetical protein